ncbi:MAG TPA: TolC family outer membrane protein [Burkholderiales bacterium]|jgi:outer membrane protein|nr:TolC family outer membrane protein [Burkholderiales bacterium]HEX2651131.1 TolC family outer membrane protein [Burkholderiales bacterium]
MRLIGVLLFFAALAPQVPANAQDLLQVYRDAKSYDAQYASARSALQAGLEKLPQGRALILPQVGLSANLTSTRIETVPHNITPFTPSILRDAHSFGYSLSFSQPIYRPQNLIQYGQAEYQVRQAEAVFGQAAQDLIVRTAQAYFDVLASQDSLALVQAQKVAISEQLAQAKRNFEVGTATITDTHEAQARYDLAVAQEIAAQSDLEAKKRALQQITGKEYGGLRPLRAQVRLSPPNPSNMQSWVDISEKQGYPVLIQEAATGVANLEVKRNAAAHRPTVDLVASYGLTNQSASQLSAVPSNITTGVVGVQLGVPIYQGGLITSREREAAANYEKARQDLDNARRTSALQTRQTYLSVINGIAQVGALEQALVSSQSALDSNKLGYEVGVRINIDVLNSQQQLFSTRRDLAVARYNTITAHLRLKAAAGSLREEDLEEVNRALEP